MAYDEALAERVRAALFGREAVEKRMMGGVCYMIRGHMCCGVSGSAVMVRVGAAGYAAALALPHVRPLEFGGRRPGGFVLVDAAGVRSEAALRSWVERGVDFAATLPAKSRRPANGPRRKEGLRF